MAEYFKLHPQHPQARSIQRIAAALREGAVMLYPTDTVYAIGCSYPKPARTSSGSGPVRSITVETWAR